MRVAFYIASKGNKLDKWIGLLTWGKYSHCELVFEEFVNTSYSSSPRDGGTRFKKIDFNPEHWDFVEIDLSVEEEWRALVFCKEESGKPYDWFGAIFRLPILNGRWYCSEVCVEALKIAGFPIKQSAFWSTPNTLFKELRDAQEK